MSQVEILHAPPQRLVSRRRFFPRLGIRAHLGLLIGLLLVPLILLEIWIASDQYNIQRQSVTDSRAQTARSIGQTLTVFVQQQLRNTQALAYSFDGSRALSVEEGNAILTDFRRVRPVIHSYMYVAPDGRVIYADPPSLVGQRLADEDFWKLVIQGEEYGFSNLRVSEVDGLTPVFSVAGPVLDQTGGVHGTIIATVDTTKLGDVVAVPLGARANFSIHDRDAQSIYISSRPNEPYEQRIQRARPVPSFIADALAGKEALVPSWTSRVDGLERLGASVPISQLGWSASVSEPVEDAMALTSSLILRRLALFLLAGGVALFIGVLYGRWLIDPLRDLSRAADAFGRGDLDQRVPHDSAIAEVDTLTQSFNMMAEQVSRETRSRDAFFSQAAHELKTPLASIKGGAQLLIRQFQSGVDAGGELPARTSRSLKTIELQSERMTQLIARLLDLNQIERGVMTYQWQEVDLRQLVEKCVATAHYLTVPERHSFVVELPALDDPDGWLVRGDPLRLEQVILNLLENALKYSPKGGAIRVCLTSRLAGQPQHREALLEIQDQGVGLDTQTIPKLFERYYRVNSNGTHTISGLGLGLYISQEIAQKHDGLLWATSPGLGKGSTFWLALPLVDSDGDAR